MTEMKNGPTHGPTASSGTHAEPDVHEQLCDFPELRLGSAAAEQWAGLRLRGLIADAAEALPPYPGREALLAELTTVANRAKTLDEVLRATRQVGQVVEAAIADAERLRPWWRR
ncbi:hypothetical protein ABZ840_06610 [Streptomyces sp. NPDC047117]|uniref:hypothetical protein n=1 Tax=unclassified Streptomyces TaxID=2593676 RepID=UPI003404EFC2